MYHYTMCGLDNVWLENGYTETDTPYDKAVKIEDADELDRAIAMALVDKPEPLSGKEFRFLRQQLGMSQADVGSLLGSTDQTIARWEKGTIDLPVTADKLFRVIFMAHEAGGTAIWSMVAKLNFMDRIKHHKIVFVKNGEWEQEQCANC